MMVRTVLVLAVLAVACSGSEIPDTHRACAYSQAPSSCCGSCGGGLWCNTTACRCEDVTDPCATSTGQVGSGTTPDPGSVPAGTVGSTGGTVDRLWFTTTGDTRPGSCDQTKDYPKAAITQIAASMKALKSQFTVDLGDHMYVCNGSDAEAQEQMGFYTAAMAGGPSTWFMTMGNHECGNNTYPYSCFTDAPHDANFAAYMGALKRPLPYYSYDVQTSQGLARFVIIADDSWNAAQDAWLESTLADADARPVRYTIIARHHPMTGTRTGNAAIGATIGKHKYSLILTAHNHSYSRDTATWQGRAAVVGLGGAPGPTPGFGTVAQNADGTLTFVLRDAIGNPMGTPWAVPPQ